MGIYEYESITEGHKGTDLWEDDDSGTPAKGNRQTGTVLDYTIGHSYRASEPVQYYEKPGERYAGDC